jgi:hypothetical protein
LTFFTAYEPERFVSVAIHNPEFTWSLWFRDAQGICVLGPLGYNFILLGLGFAAFVGATVVFRIRDLPAPL